MLQIANLAFAFVVLFVASLEINNFFPRTGKGNLQCMTATNYNQMDGLDWLTKTNQLTIPTILKWYELLIAKPNQRHGLVEFIIMNWYCWSWLWLLQYYYDYDDGFWFEWKSDIYLWPHHTASIACWLIDEMSMRWWRWPWNTLSFIYVMNGLPACLLTHLLINS